MDETGERPAPAGRGVWLALGQVGLAGVAGAVLLPVAPGLLLGAVFGGDLTGLAITGLVGVVVFVGVLAGVSLLGREESWLTRTWAGRVLWGILVGGIGCGLWLLGWRISDEAGLGFSRASSVWVPLTAVPFALVAGLLLRRWYLALGSLAALVGVGAFLLHALAAALPPELDERLAYSDVARGSLMATTVPGYHVVPDQTFWHLIPDDWRKSEGSPNVVLNWEPDSAQIKDCYPPATYAGAPTCEIERPGLAYLNGKGEQIYYHRALGQRFTLSAPTTIDRAVLRDAILAIRAVAEGSFTTTVPGYSAPEGGHMGRMFTPDDKTTIPGARNITVEHRSTAGQNEGEVQQRETESPELRYERFEAAHRYVRLVGGEEVSVKGGLGVSRDVLRTAALGVHPATDDELRAVLPEVPPSRKDRTLMAPVRELAREIFGR